MRKTVLVTGATGFLGGTIVEALHFAGQYDVRAGIRSWTSAPRIARLAVPIVQCDVTNAEQFATALAGVDYVIHCAVSNDQRVITEGTTNLLRAARTAGTQRIVHISSVAIYGAATGLVDEMTVAPEGTLTPYGAAKVNAEAACGTAQTQVVILRPSIVYGPFSALWTVLFDMRLRSGLWADFGAAADGKCNLVHANDVASYAVSALTIPGVAGKAYNINGPEIITWNSYFHAFNAALGLPSLPQRPVDKARVAARLTKPVRTAGKYALNNFSPQLIWLTQRSDRLKTFMKRTELMLRCTPNIEELRLFGLDAVYTTTQAEHDFGMSARIGITQGLDTTIAWLNHMGEAT